jgi:hypothetical protein
MSFSLFKTDIFCSKAHQTNKVGRGLDLLRVKRVVCVSAVC